MLIRPGQPPDFDRLYRLSREHTKELGFLNPAQLRQGLAKGEVLIDETSGAFVLFHKRRDGATTIYDIVVPVAARGQGIGRALIAGLSLPIQLKCVMGEPANEFYARVGFKCIGYENGKHRKLIKWRNNG
jgi:GNAT superfamily N-acetyltransferase